jgi:hypothetical protein
MRRRRLAGVDLGTDEIERPLEPRDLQEREVVGGIGVAPIKLLADDLLDTTQAEVFRSGDRAHRLPAHQAGEDPPRALVLLGQDLDGLCGWRAHAASFRRNRQYSTNSVKEKLFCDAYSVCCWSQPRRHGRACPGYPRGQRFETGPTWGSPQHSFCRHKAFALAALTNIRCAEPRG